LTPNEESLPTIGQAISNWLGIQLPAIPMPQTLKNFDKAVGKILLAVGENVETRIKSNTAKAEIKGKLNVEGMYRTEEEKRKIENRAETTKAALEEIKSNPGQEDAKDEIEDDWLNAFARISEDKSSEELQILFGKILAGEIKRPGSFSLRTMQTMATISKADAETLSRLLSYSIDSMIVPFHKNKNKQPTHIERLFLEELGIAGHPSEIGGMEMTVTVEPNTKRLLQGSHLAILIDNQMPEAVKISIPGQILTSIGRELIKIANPPDTDIEFLKNLSEEIYKNLRTTYATQMDKNILDVHVATTEPVGENRFRFQVVYSPKTSISAGQ
jgi:hypothetical protein